MSGPLAGRRVVVTRASDQAGAFSSLLREAGAEVIEVPLVRIVDAADDGAALRFALGRLADFDWLVITSPNGAARVAAALAGGDRASVAAGDPSHLRIAVVGSATADALGRPVDLVPGRQIGEALVEAFPAGPGRVLLVQGELARRDVEAGLTAKGWAVERVVAYRTVPQPIPEELADSIAAADAITFLSGSAAAAFASAAISGRLVLPRHVVSIGPATTQAAMSAGVFVTATAQLHTLGGTVATLVRELGIADHNG